ncbi:MAG: hypothetical protein CBC83_03765 [Flavobacteriales bacterium TMED123]|nr:MAG: hypothetical protein CBC83_03765 [Flavobacteriales bacterium TMED123]
MKKLFTILFAGIFTFSVSAQTDQGTILFNLGTPLGFSSTSVTDVEGNGGVSFGDVYNKWTMSSLNLDLTDFSSMLDDVTMGYFVSDNIVVGLKFGISSGGMKQEFNGGPNVKQDSSSMTLGPVFRYYIEAGDMYLFPQIAYVMGSGKTVNETSIGTTTTTSEVENKSSNLSIGFGMAILLGDYITLEPTLSYNIMSQTVVDGGFDASGNTVDRVTKMSQIHFGINLSYHLEM